VDEELNAITPPIKTPELEICQEDEEKEDPRAFAFIGKIDPHENNRENYEKLTAKERNFMGNMTKCIG